VIADPHPASWHRLQELVDSLAVRLSRPVLIDDATLRPLAYSPQKVDRVDRVRAHSILAREAPPEAAAFLLGHGIEHADGPLRVPGSDTIGLDARLCIRLATEAATVGYLWVVDEDGQLDPGALAVLDRVAEGATALLDTRPGRLREQQLRERVDALLSTDAAVSCDAAADLLEAGAFRTGAGAAVLVATVVPPPGEEVDETVTVLLSRGLHAFAGQQPARDLLLLTRRDHVAVVVGDSRSEQLTGRLPALGEELLAHVRATVPAEGWEVAVGIGTAAGSLAGAPRSYVQALQAASVAARIPQVGAVLDWSGMGIYRLLAPVADSAHDSATLPPALLRLLHHPGGEMLLHTLETYLDHGGDAQATTAELFLARGSLYYRLHRIEEIAEVSLRSGHDRLMLHLGLKLARLGGLYPTAPVEPAAAEDRAADL
jgi:PucR C-terminal helix-turn-helix domain/GGDEF-like domain